MDEPNPNESPKVDATTPDEGVPISQRLRRFPWRIIPVAILYLYGGLAVLASIVWVYMVFGGCAVFVQHHTHFASDLQIYALMFGMVLFGVHGCLAIAVGRYLWKRWLRRSMLALAGAIILPILAYLTSYIVDRMPPGRLMPPPTGSTSGPAVE